MMTRRQQWAVVGLALLTACGPAVRDSGGADADTGGPDAAPGVDAQPTVDGPSACADQMPALATGASIDPAYAQHYTLFTLGPAPGVPGPLGGSVISSSDPNTLLIAGKSEGAGGAIYAIKVKRNVCGHIYAFDGSASLQATTPYVDASLVYTANDTLLYTEWPNRYNLSELPPSATTAARSIDLQAHGMMGGGLGSLGYVPPGFGGAGGLRGATQPEGYWYHIDLASDGSLYSVTGSTMTVTLPHWPGGFAYVPTGSPSFTNPGLVVAEWNNQTVAAYDVDAQGDPIVSTRRPFIDNFDQPWGAYFEPTTGDYLFLSWGAGQNEVFIVQGFSPPVLQ
jgi:hypothetical protein